METKVTLARTPTHLKQILKLQAANTEEVIDGDTARSQGFVTAVHDLELLQRMKDSAASVIAVQGRKVVGYCLAMTREFGESLPVLAPLFERQDAIEYRGKPLGETGYLVMGQLCVAEHARGKKLADRMYKYLRGCYHLRFPYCVTAIDVRNTRSLRVHERIGFAELDRFTATDLIINATRTEVSEGGRHGYFPSGSQAGSDAHHIGLRDTYLDEAVRVGFDKVFRFHRAPQVCGEHDDVVVLVTGGFETGTESFAGGFFAGLL